MAVGQKRRHQRLDRFFGLSLARPQLHQRAVHDDAVQPGGEAGIAVKVSQAAKRVEKGVLNDVSRLLVVADDAACDREQPRRIDPDQLLVRGILATAEPGQKVGFFNGKVRAVFALTLIDSVLRQTIPY